VCAHDQPGDCRALVVDVAGFTGPDMATVDALARLQVAAQRVGLRLELRHAPPALRELVALAGLDDVLTLS
jgi:ABC-type transporter Mla MlaB component